jgi:hypothetical protein
MLSPTIQTQRCTIEKNSLSPCTFCLDVHLCNKSLSQWCTLFSSFILDDLRYYYLNLKQHHHLQDDDYLPTY